MTEAAPSPKKYSLQFEIDDLPKRPNQLLGSHWRRRIVHAKKWADLVALATNQFRPAQPLRHVMITLTRVSSSEPDFDGTVGSFKAILDGLVKNGIILDDTVNVIGAPEYKWEKGIKGHGKVRVKVIEI